MAGLYIHIPFCGSRCVYCDFYSTTSLELREQYVDCLCEELKMKQTAEPIFASVDTCTTIETIYFGGGTPSLLTPPQILRILRCIAKYFTLAPDIEITLEANPQDLHKTYITSLLGIGINRLSIGCQSFQNDFLKFLHRRHTAEQAIQVVELAHQCGFENISVDLIYGLPKQTLKDFQQDIQTALSLPVKHISTYCLTIEENTPLHKMFLKDKSLQQDDEMLNDMYSMLCEKLNSWYHYEVSNFAINQQFISQHNSSYWNNTPYLGIGAGAHSYDGKNTRSWNISNLQKYISDIKNGVLPCEKETLTDENRLTELVMLRLRTKEGINLTSLNEQIRNKLLSKAKPFIESGKLKIADNHLSATLEGIAILNLIIEELI